METSKAKVRVGRLILTILCGAALGTFFYYAPQLFVQYHTEAPAGELRSAGTSAAGFMIDKWKDAYRKQTGVKLIYQSTGSTEGITRMIDRNCALGFTHNPLSEKQKKSAAEAGGEVLHIPVAICAVVPVYYLKDLKGKPPLKFTRETLADIFLGKITRWNDPALAKINEGVKLPDLPIQVFCRADKSGTNQIFTEYLEGANEEWKQKIGKASSSVNWPVGKRMPRSSDVIAHIETNDGAIGYADLVNAVGSMPKVSYGAVQNKDRTAFVLADPEKMTAAAKTLAAEIGGDMTFHLTNKAGKDAYPICGGIWAVCYQNQPAEKFKVVADFLAWVVHEGQPYTVERSYAPLPEDVVKRIDEKLKLLKSS